ncbi:helix-turn-helix domain-containing protein [Paraperlucidibaca sp.]|uniref:helix-turn-helix domain-containing protein n=1 Tax=Paraperlucidibaca sp. TaxID=2708021 RepID=UPI0030F49472
MSIKLMSSVFELSLRPADKLVLLALADHADDEGSAWPSIETLAKKSSTSRRTVLRILKELEQSGLLTRQKRSRKNGSRTSSLYKLFLGDNLSPRKVNKVSPNGTTGVSNQVSDGVILAPTVTTRTIKPNLNKNPASQDRTSELTSAMRATSEDMLARLPRTVADQVRRDWLVRLSMGGVKSPMSYLACLVKHALVTYGNEGHSLCDAVRSTNSSAVVVAEHLAEIRSKLAGGLKSC